MARRRPGEVRDAIMRYLLVRRSDASVAEIGQAVSSDLGHDVAPSSVRSYLNLNTPSIFRRTGAGRYRLGSTNGHRIGASQRANGFSKPIYSYGHALLYHADCCEWLRSREPTSIHAVVTDPPYGMVEYTAEQQDKMRSGRGGVWRIPPSFDGCKRSPVPRFTVLTKEDLHKLRDFFVSWGQDLLPALVPGAHVVIASNPLVSYIVSYALAEVGLERRGELIRRVMTLRGGDRPKNAHKEFPEVSVMPRSMWEPWLLFRKPLEGRVHDNLRRFGTGALRRPCRDRPFGDLIESPKTPARERRIAPHPSLKPQGFLRSVVRAVLPLGEGVVLDPFAGSGSTLAAAEFNGYQSIGVESDKEYIMLAKRAIPKLVQVG